jgi:manganese-dependent inorganic pyrophosphatase
VTAPIYVLGHRNPDTDAVCAAIGYAALMQLQGRVGAVAGRQGELRPETTYVLERFGLDIPPLVTDVRPRVADLMTAPAVSVHRDHSILEVGQTLEQHGIRVVTVTDDEGHLVGVTGQAEFAQTFVADLAELDHVYLDRGSLLRTLGGNVLVEAPGRILRNQVMVGAMEVDSMVKRLSPGILMVVGDRTDVQRAAIELGVGGLVVTGDHAITREIIELARERDVMLVSVPHHTYTTLRLIQLSSPIGQVMRTQVATCRPDDLVEEVREQLGSGPTRSLVVVDEENMVQGIISRSNLLRTVRQGVVLVDHNERGQAVTGIEEAEVLAVIDHHRVADFWTRNPPYMRLEPVGATSTIVAKLFDEAQITVPPSIAGILLSAILTDTLLFRGPTTTAEDRRVALRLAQTAEVDVEELGNVILKIASDVSDRSAEQLLMGDFKEFSVEHCRFGIGTIETADGSTVLARRDELLTTMDAVRGRGYTSVLFAVIDIVRERSTILADGYAGTIAATFGGQLTDDHIIELPGIISRKKNIVPLLGDVARQVGRLG